MSACSTPLRARDLVKIYRGRCVLDQICVTAAPGQRLGLVGENGVGKSTLLRLLAGVEDPDGGELSRPPDTGFLAQELPHSPATTVAAVLDAALWRDRAALRRLDELAPRLADPQAADEYADVLDWAQRHQAWDADRRAAVALSGLGLGTVAAERTLGTLSGGQRPRLGLAAMLLRQPAALLLDGPTNHLSLTLAAELEDAMRVAPGTIVVATHDRWQRRHWDGARLELVAGRPVHCEVESGRCALPPLCDDTAVG